MAKISTIKIDIKGVEYNININVNSRGIFSCKLPIQVAQDLRIKEEHTSLFLHELEKSIKGFIETYKNSVTTNELFILVAYQATGYYMQTKDGGYLFPSNDDKYRIQSSFNEVDNAIGLDFIVAIKETIDGKDVWYKAKLGKHFSHIQEKEYSEPNVYHKCTKIYDHKMKRYKAIPFNEAALLTLQNTQEKFRTISEYLYKFITQDEENIMITLTSNKLLN
jgi:hypothetical protein